MKRKLFILGLSLVIALSCSIMAFATSYTSNMSISGNSTLKGATRSYVGSTHNISILLSSMYVPGVKSNYCKIYLDKYNLIGSDDTINYSTKNFTSIGSTYSMKTKNVDDGKYYYFFNNVQMGSGFTSENTTMSSK